MHLIRHGKGDYSAFGSAAPADVGVNLFLTYVAWATAVAIVYPLCRWFAGLKQRRRDAWLSYF